MPVKILLGCCRPILSNDDRVHLQKTGLKKVTFPDSVKEINGFNGCTGLTEITIPDSIKHFEAGTFEGCTNLKRISVPKAALAHWEEWKVTLNRRNLNGWFGLKPQSEGGPVIEVRK